MSDWIDAVTDWSAGWIDRPGWKRPPQVIEGQVVDAPLVLGAAPARAVEIVCGTHPAWLECGMTGRRCVQVNVPVEEPDQRTWSERRSTFRVVDRRRSSLRGWK